MFTELEHYGHEQVILCSDPQVGLRAIIAIHDTTLGPALGGTRMWQYASDADALTDVLRLSRGMTYKAAVAGLNLGGGKAVILGDPHTQKTEMLFRSYGRFIESLRGRYITAEDVGTTVRDMEWIRMETQYVTGVGGEHGSGDPSPYTALGVFVGMKAAAKITFGTESLSGKRIAVQGAGNVARHLVGHLVKDGAQVTVTDIFEDKARALCEEYGVAYVEPEKIFDVECDIFSPNALGAVLNDATIPRLRCTIVAGGANNQLADEERHARMLAERGILYAPDYVINAGGLINVTSEIEQWSREQVLRKVESIYDTLLRIFRIASENGILTIEASNKIAEERIAQARHIHRTFIGSPTIRNR
ncbi:MAG: Glu/Leu/Phe/Val dehydrogenase [Bacteroidota bacterium]|nr:leucine dehydrogenase [Candidatus Kapabacteria bacterium]MCS7301829.1 leucine dehydrogenase [Candidatus Kapabacteria bacterium]MCX7936082.1 leucine dehydrogenase [Chlorobiota bacterium]MDW8075024.1 Glu/Leu/Phe/Val dehydrogenase [Bacteroidota bacterium]MDW8271663.1 Glu/Leu/Phe/Val dehydrogenase [Bacteroidota bacterium]